MSEWTDFFAAPPGDGSGLLGVGQASLFHVVDQKSEGSNGGTSSAATWNVRNLNTIYTDEIEGASVSSNQVTLPAGSYYIEADAPVYKSDRNGMRWRNVTDNTTAVVGVNGFSDNSDAVAMTNTLAGSFIISEEKTFELQHWVELGFATFGFGFRKSGGEVEVFANVRIRKIVPVLVVGGLAFKGIRRHRTTQSGNFPTGATNNVVWDDVDEIQYDIGGWESSDTEIVIPAGVTKVKMVFGYSTTSGSLDAGEIQFHIRRTSGGGGTIGATVVENIETTIANKGSVDTGIFEVTPGETFKVDFGHNTGGNQALAATETFWSVEAVEGIAPSTTPRGALVNQATSFSLSNNITTVVTWNNEIYNTDNIHNNSVDNSRLTVPAGVSHVRLSANYRDNSNTAGWRFFQIRKNGSLVPGTGTQSHGADSTNAHMLNAGSSILEVVQGDYFEMAIFQNSGSTRSISGDEFWFAMEIVEPAVVAAGLINVVEDVTPQLGGELDALSNKIVNLTDPTIAQDAATKKYVDDSITFSLSSSLINVVEDLTPQLGGDLDVNGNNITMTGAETVDGRDLSVDGAKLDLIEASATVDQSASEILTAIKTVDGTGSGLDADLLDGSEGNAFAKTADNNTYTKAQRGAPVAIASSATITPDFDAGNNFEVDTIDENFTLANPTNMTNAAGQSGAIVIVQDGTGSRLLSSVGSFWKFSGGGLPVLSTDIGAIDTIVYYVRSSTFIIADVILDAQ